jgi:hypothetical protein
MALASFGLNWIQYNPKAGARQTEKSEILGEVAGAAGR